MWNEEYQEAVKKALQRLARRQRVVKVKNYFYVIVPLEYRHAGSHCGWYGCYSKLRR